MKYELIEDKVNGFILFFLNHVIQNLTFKI